MVFKFPVKETYRVSGRTYLDCSDHPDYKCKTGYDKIRRFNERLNKMKLKSEIMRETIAEFIGTFVLVLIGDCMTAALVFNRTVEAGSIIGPLAWGLGLILAICITGGVSGCHANPAVTLALATVGKCKWKKVGPYFLAQYLGAFVASAVLYFVYIDAFSQHDGGLREVPPNANATAQIFATYMNPHVTLGPVIFDNIVSTMIFMMAIVAVCDPNNMQVPKGTVPLLIGFCLSATIYAFPYNCGAPLNPARDFSPRLFTAIAGWGGAVFSHRNYQYFWVPIVGPHVGAILGALVYKFSIEMHWPSESYDLGEVKSMEKEKGLTNSHKKIAE